MSNEQKIERNLPLAVTAGGERVAVPENAAGWRAWRHTRGRPRAVLTSDGQPVSLPLDATIDDLADELGPGAYRLRAVTAFGELLDVSVDHEITADGYDPAPVAIDRRGGRAPREEIAVLVNGLVEMPRCPWRPRRNGPRCAMPRRRPTTTPRMTKPRTQARSRTRTSSSSRS
jgi:hypothetical protein